MKNTTTSWIATLALSLSAFTVLAAAPSPEELEKQKAFNAEYKNSDKDKRIAAVKLLDGAKHQTSWGLLQGVIAAEREAEVKIAAFDVLAKAPARDMSHAKMLAQIFTSQKPNDISTRVEFAKSMSGLEFKYDVLVVMTEFMGRQMRYPETATQANQETVTKTRKEFAEYLSAYNALANSDVSSPSKNTPTQLKKWWELNGGKFAQGDKELADKYRKEDQEAAKKK